MLLSFVRLFVFSYEALILVTPSAFMKVEREKQNHQETE